MIIPVNRDLLDLLGFKRWIYAIPYDWFKEFPSGNFFIEKFMVNSYTKV